MFAIGLMLCRDTRVLLSKNKIALVFQIQPIDYLIKAIFDSFGKEKQTTSEADQPNVLEIDTNLIW